MGEGRGEGLMFTNDDILLMHEAMMLAQKGEGKVNPNPLVGALIVVDDDVVASGYHHAYGGLHAEREAFKDADARGIDCTGATMYVTLEPCCHYGKQPPCTEAIIEHKISRVVVGLTDPNPLVAGKGIQQLRDAGIEVDMLEHEELLQDLRMQNRVFLHYIQTKRPWVTAKWAMTLDGKIATSTGDSKWITGEKARERVHMVRKNNTAIMCGIGTVLADDPMLNVRLSDDALKRLGITESEVRQPVRIVADRKVRIPMDSQLVKSAREIPLVVAHAEDADEKKLQMLRDAGVMLWQCNSMREIMERAGQEKLDSLFLEGGGTVNDAMLREGLVNEVMAFVAPKIIGGKDAKTPVEGYGFTKMADAIELKDLIVEKIGEDIMVSGIVRSEK